MFYPTGVLVSIPLTLLQSNVFHIETGQFITNTIPLITLNSLLSHAVYDKDRLIDNKDDSFYDVYTASTNMALLTSSAILWNYDDVGKLLILPLILLNQFYAKIKPIISTAKPFVVSFFWTMAICCLPFFVEGKPLPDDPLIIGSMFILTTALSNMADISDIREDYKNGLYTPAVSMGTKQASLYTLSCVIISVLFHYLMNDSNYDDLSKKIDMFNLIVVILQLAALNTQNLSKD